MSSYWRVAGLNYLQYAEIASSTFRQCLKEPLRSSLAARSEVHVREALWTNGARGERGKFYKFPHIEG